MVPEFHPRQGSFPSTTLHRLRRKLKSLNEVVQIFLNRKRQPLSKRSITLHWNEWLVNLDDETFDYSQTLLPTCSLQDSISRC